MGTATFPGHNLAGSRGNLLCVANFPANTGFAWDFIESLYARIADHFSAVGIRTWVAYPAIRSSPKTLKNSAAQAVHLSFQLNSVRNIRVLLRFVRRARIRVLYLTDQPMWHPLYPALRLAGVRRIIVHGHTSGERDVPRGFRRLAKRLSRRVPGMLADDVIGVSDYVVKRTLEVALVPANRVKRVWNSTPVPVCDPDARARLHASFDVPSERPIIICACRATPEKGVMYLFRAFDRVIQSASFGSGRPVLVYLGDGPSMPELRELYEELSSKDDIIIGGYRDNVRQLLQGADICVVPSVWQDALPLSALEPMAHGIPVIASRVGGIPEMVVHGETGLLVSPGSVVQLEQAIHTLLIDAEERRRLGDNGRLRAKTHFSVEAQLQQLISIVENGFA
jgi:glycosyltransferase involved in cell wall biosynthesis